MPSALQKLAFSSSNFGRGILITATADPGTLLHSGTNSTTSGTYDEIFVFFHNPGTGNLTGVIEWGSNSSPADIMTYIIPGQSTVEVVPGFVLQSGLVVRGYCQTSSGIIANGFVNRITN